MTIRDDLIKEVVEKINSWNKPIWYNNEYGDKLVEHKEIDGDTVAVTTYPIYWNDDNAIWQQAFEINYRTGEFTEYLYNLSEKGQTRLINYIRKQLRYKMVKE
jgi:hypothetical protein